MRRVIERNVLLLATAVLAAILSGCGGGGGTKSDTDTGMTGGTDPGMTGGTGPGMTDEPALTIGEGLARSTATPVDAGSAGDTLAALLPDSANQFAPLTSAIQRDFGAPSTTTSESHVKTISSDGNNGFHVSYVVGGEEMTIHFEEADYETYNFYKEVDGVHYWLWSHTGAFGGTDKNRGSSRYRYVDLSGFERYHEDDDDADDEGVDHRSHLSYGVRTDAADLPAGSATYSGIMEAETHLKSDPSRAHREAMKGILRLTANFDDSTLDGMVLGIRVRTRNQNNDGWNAWAALPDTTHFEVGDGRIVDGQFAAALTGVDSDAGAAPGETVGGYEGGILGELYGPAAEEVGGVLNASRHDRVMHGVFAGKQGGPAAPGSATGLNRSMADPVYATNANDSYEALSDQGRRFAPLTAALRRDSYELSSTPDDDAYVKATWIEGDVVDGSGRLHMSYVADGEEHTVGFTTADYDADDGFNKEMDGAGSWLWSLTGSFEGHSGYRYLDLYGFGHYGAGPSYNHFLTFGARTDPANLPAGSAIYAGRIRADSYKQNDPSSAFRIRVYGDLSLAANFDAATLEGTVSEISTRGNESNRSPLSETTSFEIGNGQIANGRFTATLTGVDTNSGAALDDSVSGYEGNVLGEFYGPAAEEVGGVFTASRAADDRVLYGALYGQKQ